MGRLIDNTYKNINSALKNNAMYKSNYADYAKDLYQAKINDSIEYSTNFLTIDEELTFGKEDYSKTDVRINHVIGDTNTGEKLGDDYRSIVFRTIEKAKGLGYRYSFSDNIWLTCYSDLYNKTTSSVVVRRCNTTMNWLTNDKKIHKEPCVKDNQINYTRFNMNNHIILNDGEILVTVQSNDYTRNIKVNDRFLFGSYQNIMAYKVESIDGTANNNTYDDTSNKLLYIKMAVNQLDANDDKVNRVAKSDITKPTNSQIIITPENFGILQGFSMEYTINNSTSITDVTTNIPSGYYTFATNGNKFTIKNIKMYNKSKVKIKIVNDTEEKIFEFSLKGAF